MKKLIKRIICLCKGHRWIYGCPALNYKQCRRCQKIKSRNEVAEYLFVKDFLK